MDLLKVLAMPFQLASLLFVAASSLLLGLVISLGGGGQLTTVILSLFVFLNMLIWLTNYALHLIDDAANGVREAKTASVEMLTNPYLDSRCWVHPLTALALGTLHYLHPLWPAWPTLLTAALLFPASIGACAMSGRARDALNPLVMLRVVHGLGPWYAPLVLFIAACATLGVILARNLQLGSVLIAIEQLLVLIAYAAIGGALFERRIELGFEPRLSPERAADGVEAERVSRRQHFLDGLYNDTRVRETQRAIANTRQWLGNARPNELAGDVHAIIIAGRNWPKLRDYPRLLQGLVSVLLELKQPALANSVVDAALVIDSGFSPDEESDVVALVGYALATGRRRSATQMLHNYLQRTGAGRDPGPQLVALRGRLQPPT